MGLGPVHGPLLVLGGDREADDRRRRVRPDLAHCLPRDPVGEQKVAGERLLLRQVSGGLQILAPGRDETIPQPPDWEAGYPRAVREALEAYGRGDPPPIPASECAHAVRLIFEAYRA